MRGPFLCCFKAHTEEILILRKRNPSKDCLLRFFFLSIKIPPPFMSQTTSKTTAKIAPYRTFALKYSRFIGATVVHYFDDKIQQEGQFVPNRSPAPFIQPTHPLKFDSDIQKN